MAVHLGRLKIVTRRKLGQCRYPLCPKDRVLSPGEQTIVVTKRITMGGNPNAIAYKAFHPDPCFGAWATWTAAQIPESRSGRKIMDISPEQKEERDHIVRTRARLLRRLREVKSPTKLDELVARIAGLDAELKEMGLPVIPYRGRRSAAEVDLGKLIKEAKEKHESPQRVPREMWKRAKALGMEQQFSDAMDQWYNTITSEVSSKQYETED